jgi:hypothetical protein
MNTSNLSCQQKAALIALRDEGPLTNSKRFSAYTLNSLVDRGLVEITKGKRGKSRKCSYQLTTNGRWYARTRIH